MKEKPLRLSGWVLNGQRQENSSVDFTSSHDLLRWDGPIHLDYIVNLCVWKVGDIPER